MRQSRLANFSILPFLNNKTCSALVYVYNKTCSASWIISFYVDVYTSSALVALGKGGNPMVNLFTAFGLLYMVIGQVSKVASEGVCSTRWLRICRDQASVCMEV